MKNKNLKNFRKGNLVYIEVKNVHHEIDTRENEVDEWDFMDGEHAVYVEYYTKVSKKFKVDNKDICFKLKESKDYAYGVITSFPKNGEVWIEFSGSYTAEEAGAIISMNQRLRECR